MGRAGKVTFPSVFDLGIMKFQIPQRLKRNVPTHTPTRDGTGENAHVVYGFTVCSS